MKRREGADELQREKNQKIEVEALNEDSQWMLKLFP